jgi:hypothetical protein
MSLNKSGNWRPQADATLSETDPVVDTYYTVLETSKMTRLIAVAVSVAEAGETLALRVTIGGKVYNGTVEATAAHVYQAANGVAILNADSLELIDAASLSLAGRSFLREGRGCKVEVAKTTEAGAGTLAAKAIYDTQ